MGDLQQKKDIPKKSAARAPRGRTGSFHKLVDGKTQAVNGILVSGLHSVHHAVAHMVFQDDLTGVVQSGADSGQLNQDLGAVVAFLHHPLHLFQVADGPGQTVDHSLLVFVDVTVGVGDAVEMLMDVVVMVGHGRHLLSIVGAHYTPVFPVSQAPPGDISGKINALTDAPVTDIIKKK